MDGMTSLGMMMYHGLILKLIDFGQVVLILAKMSNFIHQICISFIKYAYT